MIFGKCDKIMDEDFLKKLYGTDLRIIPVKELGRKICAVPELNLMCGGGYKNNDN